MPPITRSAARSIPPPSSSSNRQSTPGSTPGPARQATPQAQPSSSTNDRDDAILKTFNRHIDERAERSMDAAVLEGISALNPTSLSAKDTKAYGILLAAISEELQVSAQNQDTMIPGRNAALLAKSPKLLELLFECYIKKNFTPIRNLELLRPPPGPEEGLEEALQDVSARLKVFVRNPQTVKWEKEDLVLEENNVRMHEEDDRAFFQEIIDQLGQVRLYTLAEVADEPPRPISTLQLVQSNFQREFDKVFKLGEPRKKTNTRRELMALYTILDCFWSDIQRARKDDFSSSSLTSIFCNNFIHPAIFYPNFGPSRPLEYQEGESWHYSMIVEETTSRSRFKFQPRNDWELRARDIGLPLAICEVISHKNRSDEWRMLLEAVAISRLGNFLLKSEAQLFFLVAVYFDYDLTASRYIVMPEDKSATAKVHIVKKDFDLKERDDATLFLTEMLNLASIVEDFAKDLDSDKQKEMEKVQSRIRDLLSSLTTEDKKTEKGKEKPSKGSMGTIHEKADEGVPPHFHSRNIGTVLDNLGLVFGYADFVHQSIALIFDKEHEDVVEYLKFVKNGSRELEILNYLAEYETDYNHAIRPIRSWAVLGGTMVSLPPVGTWITDVKEMSKHLGGLVRQLVEGIAFLHACNVAHLDIKPHNLIIPSSYGRLSIIDFNVSIYLKDPTVKYDRRVGTKGYMAPEVGAGPYDPFKADLYSCGVVLKELCEIGKFSAERRLILTLADELTDADPDRRPSMGEVLASLNAPVKPFAEGGIDSYLFHHSGVMLSGKA